MKNETNGSQVTPEDLKTLTVQTANNRLVIASYPEYYSEDDLARVAHVLNTAIFSERSRCIALLPEEVTVKSVSMADHLVPDKGRVLVSMDRAMFTDLKDNGACVFHEGILEDMTFVLGSDDV